ncbi:MAG: PKD domain-containing protein [Bacteroidetes bacterium]|nr:PKD domain-containing protein [Bacteroidota bacterium]
MSKPLSNFSMKHLLSSLIIIFCITHAKGQKRDYIWLFGDSSNPINTDWGGTVIDFNNEPPKLSYLYNEMNFLEVNASICNFEGELQCYTNGQYIANYNHQPIQNGIGLNPGVFGSDLGDNGYILDQGAIIIPHPDGSNKYYIFHENREYSTIELGGHSSKLYYSLVDMDFNNGLGKVIKKNQVILSDTLGLGKLTAVRHGNGRDWWMVVHEMASRNYYRLLIAQEGIQNIGKFSTSFAIPDEGVGQSVFSPDGSVFARMNTVSLEEGQFVDVYQFDRCTGELSGQIQINYDEDAYSAGIAISPNSRFLYVTSFTKVYQFDLWSNNIPASKVTVATYDGFYDSGSSTTFYMAQLAPDGKIYINVPGGVRFLHVIHNPNLPFPYCNMEQHGIQLPTFNNFSLPNFPNYRLGPLDGSACDTLGLNNHPVAKFRYDQDTLNYRNISFTDLSYYEPTQWSWDFGDGTISSEVNPVHEFTTDGAYEVCLTVSNQYSSNTYCRTLQLGTSASGEVLPSVNLTVFPNPAREATNVILSDYLPQHAMLYLHTATGQLAHQQRIGYGWNVVELENVAPGLYFYEVRDAGKVLKTGKLVKVE